MTEPFMKRVRTKAFGLMWNCFKPGHALRSYKLKKDALAFMEPNNE